MYNNLLLLGSGGSGSSLGLFLLDSELLLLGLGHGLVQKREGEVLAVFSGLVVCVRLHDESTEGEGWVSNGTGCYGPISAGVTNDNRQ